jgi:hypothetical protein
MNTKEVYENYYRTFKCKNCLDTGYITVDTFNGEHDQYESLCECRLSECDDEDETPCD